MDCLEKKVKIKFKLQLNSNNFAVNLQVILASMEPMDVTEKKDPKVSRVWRQISTFGARVKKVKPGLSVLLQGPTQPQLLKETRV